MAKKQSGFGQGCGLGMGCVVGLAVAAVGILVAVILSCAGCVAFAPA